jgi:hypothetical protein
MPPQQDPPRIETIEPAPRLVRGDPGAGLALRDGDLALRHQFGDLATQRNRISAAFQGGKVEPFVRGDEIDDAGTSARPVQAALEQDVRDGAWLHRYCGIKINMPLKHLTSPFLIVGRPPPSAAPVHC